MPEPIGSNPSAHVDATRHYDSEAGVCASPQSPTDGTPSSVAPSRSLPAEPEPHAPRVARLLEADARRTEHASLSDDCGLKVMKAVTSCSMAVVATRASSATGPLALAAVALTAAACAFEGADAYDCVTKSR